MIDKGEEIVVRIRKTHLANATHCYCDTFKHLVMLLREFGMVYGFHGGDGRLGHGVLES